MSFLSWIAALLRRLSAKSAPNGDVWFVDREGAVYKPTRQIQLRARAKTE